MNKIEELYEKKGLTITSENTILLEGEYLKIILPKPELLFNKNDGDLKSVPSTKGGVYMFVDKITNKVIYVGTTNSLLKRLSEHRCRGQYFDKEKHIIYWKVFKNDWERKVFEKLYQWAFKPLYGIEDKRKRNNLKYKHLENRIKKHNDCQKKEKKEGLFGLFR